MSGKPWGALPVSRIFTIMKSSSEAENIGKDSTYLMSKAAELFIKLLAVESYELSGGSKLNYKDVANVVHCEERYEFLRDIMPKKITYGEYKEIIANLENGQQRGREESSGEESDSEQSNE